MLMRRKVGSSACNPFNMLMQQKANSLARFYVSKASGLKDLSRDKLTEALLIDEALLP